MRLTKILRAQHIGFQFKKHWLVQGKRVIRDTGVEASLKSKGIPVEDALEFIKEKPVESNDVIGPGTCEPLLPMDANHPDYKPVPCFTLKNTTVLLEGVSQAQVLTKTLIVENKLPNKIEELAQLPAPKTIHQNVKKAILSANVFDCEQKKLPKIRDPERPAFNFPRILGITDKRKNQILTNKLLQLVERSNNPEVTQTKYVVNDVNSETFFHKENELIQIQELSQILVTSNKPLQYQDSEQDITYVEIPNLYPVKHTVTLVKEHFYNDSSQYPISNNVTIKHPHTTWLHFNRSEVKNIYEEAVTDIQIHGRALTHAFTVAAAYAKQLHGENVKELPEPIYINCIQADGGTYHFGVLKLNTLDLDGVDGTKNVWYTKNDMKLYDSCRYLDGMPILENYNSSIYGYINAMYNS